MGLILLLLRYSVKESVIFQNTKKLSHVSRGNFLFLFSSKKNIYRFLTGILAGTPLFFTLYTLIAYSSEFGKEIGISNISVPTASLYFLIPMTIGDFLCGLTSQYFCNRKKILIAYMCGAFFFTILILTAHNATAQYFYNLCIFAGFFMGHWSVYATTIAEQYGTNLRSTVTSTTLNFVRSTTIIFNLAVLALIPSLGLVYSMQIIGITAYIISLFFITRLKETFALDLNYNEI